MVLFREYNYAVSLRSIIRTLPVVARGTLARLTPRALSLHFDIGLPWKKQEERTRKGLKIKKEEIKENKDET